MVDLEHNGHLGNVDSVPQFPSEDALKEYSQRTGRFYRRDLVPGKSLLSSLQRPLPDSRPEQAYMDDRKKKGRKQGGIVLNLSKRGS